MVTNSGREKVQIENKVQLNITVTTGMQGCYRLLNKNFSKIIFKKKNENKQTKYALKCQQRLGN